MGSYAASGVWERQVRMSFAVSVHRDAEVINSDSGKVSKSFALQGQERR